MRRAVLTAILLCAAACANETNDTTAVGADAGTIETVVRADAGTNASEPAEADAPAEEDDADEEAEADHKQATFMIVIEHVDGWRCSGSLVSLRTALTSAWCARGRGRRVAAELWALAAAAAAATPPALTGAPPARHHSARRIVRVAVAADADAEVSDTFQWEESSWQGGAMDLAVVELEAAFSGMALTVPILMATRVEECEAGECHVARAASRPPRLRIASAELRRPATCAAAAAYWSALQERALCLVGAELCDSDWGAGVVCGGKVCGVLSRSVRAAKEREVLAARAGADGADGTGGADGAGGADGCGRTHAAQSTARWRRFLHCAHTLRACGSDGDCAQLCVERRLVEEPSPSPPAPRRPSTAPPTTPRPPPAATADSHLPRPTRTTKSARWSDSATRTPPPPPPPPDFMPPPAFTAPPAITAPPAFTAPPVVTLPPPPAAAAAADSQPSSVRLAFEFEPNRADFKAQPSQSSPSVSVYLKAGEYGDNAADYGGGDEPAPPTHTPAPATPAPTPALDPAPAPAPDSAPAPPVPPAERRSAASDFSAPTATQRSAAPAHVYTVAILILPFFVNIFSIR